GRLHALLPAPGPPRDVALPARAGVASADAGGVPPVRSPGSLLRRDSALGALSQLGAGGAGPPGPVSGLARRGVELPAGRSAVPLAGGCAVLGLVGLPERARGPHARRVGAGAGELCASHLARRLDEHGEPGDGAGPGGARGTPGTRTSGRRARRGGGA